MTAIQPITDDATYHLAEARAMQLKNNCANEAEREELDALAGAIDDYAQQCLERGLPPLDGAGEIIYMLDMGHATLGELIPIFGGIEQLIDFVTRKRNIDAATIDAIVANFDTKREWIDTPFYKPEGWQDIMKSKGDPSDWRTELMESMPSTERELTAVAN